MWHREGSVGSGHDRAGEEGVVNRGLSVLGETGAANQYRLVF